MRILILGGYGTFGGRLAQLLADLPQLSLLIAGRSQARAEAYCAELKGVAKLLPLRFDRDGEVEQQLREADAQLLVDASGPFQSYGENPYRVVQACIACGVDYMDLADGADFVEGIRQFDAAARQRGVRVLSGVSSFPVLTVAVVRSLAHDLVRVRRVSAGIAPSPYAGVGPNVIRAIAGYGGKPVRLVREGRPALGHALTETLRCTIAPPGRLPLRNLRFSLVDVPDLRVIPALWPELESVWLGAGPVPESLHRMLNGLAWLVRLRLLPTLRPLAGLFCFVIRHAQWGEHRGGMFVTVEGVDRAGRERKISWQLLAEGGDGPLIPSMAVEALVRRSLAGTRPAVGARSAAGALVLADYEALFRRRAIHTGSWEAPATNERLPLVQKLLGSAWRRLSPELRTLHGGGDKRCIAGRAEVERGSGLLSRLAAALFGFPAAGADLPLKLGYLPMGRGERCQVRLGGKSFASIRREGHGRSDRLLCLRCGVFGFAFALVLAQHRLHFVPRRWSLFGLPLPLAFAPGLAAYQDVEGNRVRFHLEIRHALTGLLLRCRGWLAPATSGDV